MRGGPGAFGQFNVERPVICPRGGAGEVGGSVPLELRGRMGLEVHM